MILMILRGVGGGSFLLGIAGKRSVLWFMILIRFEFVSHGLVHGAKKHSPIYRGNAPLHLHLARVHFALEMHQFCTFAPMPFFLGIPTIAAFWRLCTLSGAWR